MHDVLTGLLVDNVDHIINIDNADKPPLIVNHQRRHPAVFAKHMRHFFLIRINVNRHNFAVHNIAEFFIAFGAQQLVQRNFAGWPQR